MDSNLELPESGDAVVEGGEPISTEFSNNNQLNNMLFTLKCQDYSKWRGTGVCRFG